MDGDRQPPFRSVQGICPMGCGRTLTLSSSGFVTCSSPDCPKPTAVAEILGIEETEHTIRFDDDGFSVQHPLRERLGGELHDCRLHVTLSREMRARAWRPEWTGEGTTTFRAIRDVHAPGWRLIPIAGEATEGRDIPDPASSSSVNFRSPGT